MDPRVNQKLIVGICFLLMVLVGLFTYSYLNKNADKKESTSSNNLKYNLEVYGDMDGVLCLGESEECKESVMSIAVENESAKLLDITDDEKFILFDDNGMKLYDVKNNIRRSICLDGYDEYKIGYDSNTGKVIGILYYKDKYIDEKTKLESYKINGFYNIQNGKKLYEGIYDNLVLLNEKYIEAMAIVDANAEDGMEVSLLSTNEEKKLDSVMGMCEQYEVVKADAGYFIKKQSGCLAASAVSLYTENLELIEENLVNHNWSVDSDTGYLYIISDNKVNKYDSSGKLVSTSNVYQNIKQVIKNYIVYVENGMLKITNEDDVDLDVAQWGWNYDYDGQTSGYRGSDFVDNFDKVGIYINFYTYNNHVSYYLNEDTKEIVQVNVNE